MDGITGNVAQAVEAVNQILVNATQANLDLNKKLLHASTDAKLAGSETGKGQNVDTMG